jgi:tripartite-type tricarboxylate transporter receptor subunit TctC
VQAETAINTPDLQYDVVKDFEPIALLASNAQLIVAKKTTPAQDLKEFIAWLKANPRKATHGAAGIGVPHTSVGVYFQRLSGTTFQLSSIAVLLQPCRIWWVAIST